MRQPRSEQERWKVEAAELGVTLTEYIRAKVNGRTVKVVKVTDPAMLDEARRQGINLNQIAHAMNANLLPSSASVDAAMAVFRAYYMRLMAEAA